MMKNPYERVRVKDDNGHEFTTTRATAKSLNLEVTDKEAVDDSGRILPPKPYRDMKDLGGSDDPTLFEDSDNENEENI